MNTTAIKRPLSLAPARDAAGVHRSLADACASLKVNYAERQNGETEFMKGSSTLVIAAASRPAMGVDVTAGNLQGWDALMLATICGHIDVVKWLVVGDCSYEGRHERMICLPLELGVSSSIESAPRDDQLV